MYITLGESHIDCTSSHVLVGRRRPKNTHRSDHSLDEPYIDHGHRFMLFLVFDGNRITSVPWVYINT